MDDELIYILLKSSQNYFLCRVKLLVKTFRHCKLEPTNRDLIKVPKVFKQRVEDELIKLCVPI